MEGKVKERPGHWRGLGPLVLHKGRVRANQYDVTCLVFSDASGLFQDDNGVTEWVE